MARAEVIGVGVCHEMRAHLAPGELLEDPPLGSGSARIDQHVADEIDVDRVGRKALELVHALGHRPHVAIVWQPCGG
jgi:hypothetical protein